MNIQHGWIDAYSGYRLPSQQGAGRLPVPSAPRKTAERIDLVSLSTQVVSPRGVSETVESVEKGFRRTQTFETADGRSFTRSESFTETERGFRRAIIQQNPSGSTVFFEEVFDRDDAGTFRRTQRFTDETGETRANIATSIPPQEPFTLSTGGRLEAAAFSGNIRGTQLDIRA